MRTIDVVLLDLITVYLTTAFSLLVFRDNKYHDFTMIRGMIGDCCGNSVHDTYHKRRFQVKCFLRRA